MVANSSTATKKARRLRSNLVIRLSLRLYASFQQIGSAIRECFPFGIRKFRLQLPQFGQSCLISEFTNSSTPTASPSLATKTNNEIGPNQMLSLLHQRVTVCHLPVWAIIASFNLPPSAATFTQEIKIADGLPPLGEHTVFESKFFRCGPTRANFGQNGHISGR